MWFLSRFSKEEIQIIEENDEFFSVRKYLENELKNLETDNVEFIDIDKLEKELEASIRKYEA
jgi:hypothetical protein